MPQIREYTAQTDQLRPSETGVEALAMEGRRVGAFYDQAANTLRQSAADQARAAEGIATGAEAKARSFSGIAKSVTEAGDQAAVYAEHQEISHGAASFAQLHSDLTNAWNGIVSDPRTDPNDTYIAGKFRETQLEPALDKFVSSFNTAQGQQWAESHVAALRDHMFEKQTADMAGLASDAVAVNTRKMSNAWSNTARNDPSSVPFLLKTVDSSLAGVIGTSPNLKGIDAAKLHSQLGQKYKEEIVRAGALGAIEKSADPIAAADAIAKRYPEYIDGAEVGQLARVAQMQNKSNALVQKQTEIAQRQLDEQNVKNAAAKSWSNNVQWDDATGKPVINPQFGKDAVEIPKNFPNAPNGVETAKTNIDWMESQQSKNRPVDDPATLRDLTDRLYDFDNPTTRLDLMKANATGKLSDQKFTAMERLVTELQNGPLKEPIFKNAMEGAKKQIDTKANGLLLNPGDYENFVHDFLPKYLAAKRAGQLEPDALDLNNPQSLISRSIAPYKSPMTDVLKGSIAAGGGVQVPGAAPTVPPVKIATPADALKLKPGTRYIRPDGTVMTR